MPCSEIWHWWLNTHIAGAVRCSYWEYWYSLDDELNAVCIYCCLTDSDLQYLVMYCITEEWSTYLNYVRNLDFFETPDYGYIHRLFMDALDRHGWHCDWVFDWNEKQVRTVISFAFMTFTSCFCCLSFLNYLWCTNGISLQIVKGLDIYIQ